MQRVDLAVGAGELEDNFSWLASARKPQTDQIDRKKAPLRINRGKFPYDFFSNLKERKANVRLRPLVVEPAGGSDLSTPKFSSYASTIPKLALDKLNQDSTSDEATLASFASNRNCSRERTASYRKTKVVPEDRIVTAREISSHQEEDGAMCNHLRDIIRLTTSMKRVYRKQSLELKGEVPEFRQKRPPPLQLGCLELPPLTLYRKALDAPIEPHSASTRLA